MKGQQEDLFKRGSSEDQTREFLKFLFRGVERIYSFRFLEEVFQEFEFELEAERLMEEEEIRGEIEGENDF